MGAPAVESWYLSSDGNGNITSRWLMPYKKKGSLKLHNLSGGEVNVEVAVKVSHLKWDDRSLYFHASWRQQDHIYIHNNYDEETCFRSSTTHHDGTEKATKRYGLTTTGSHPTSAQARRTTTTAHGHRSIPSILLSEALHAQIWRHPTAITPFTAPAIWMPSPLKALSSLTSKCSDGTAVTWITPQPPASRSLSLTPCYHRSS